MLTNTATIDGQHDASEITATTIAIDAAERRHQAALRDITRLAETEQISADEAGGLEAETIARFVAHAHELEQALATAGAARVHSGAYLNEFAVHVPDAARVHAALLEREILAGLPLADWYPDDPQLRDALLVCATEVTTPDDIDRFAAALREVLA